MVEHLITKYAKDAGIKKHITPHKMRSSAATNLAAMGVNIQTIASMLGHENITTTQRYVAVLNEEKKNAVNALDKLI
jgi:site-specific recombinase XerD